jgi:pimeloyl-ACP methyl ester carboxylesterase
MPHPQVPFLTPGTRHPHGKSYIIINQSFIDYRPQTSTTLPHHELPLLFIHGGGLTSSIYLSTPDRRPGWAQQATNAGFHVYLADAIDLGHSQRAPDSVRTGPVEHRDALYVWTRFRIGNEIGWHAREAFAGSQFPVAAFDALIAGQAARRRNTDDVEGRALVQAIREIGPCIVVAHSHGAGIVVERIGEVEGLVKAMVLVEPGEMAKASGLRGVEMPVLVVWGDYLDEVEVWPRIRRPYKEIEGVDVLDLPRRGIRGNTHFPMCDLNSQAVWNMMQEWIDSKELKI